MFKQNGIVCDVLSMSHMKENIMQQSYSPHAIQNTKISLYTLVTEDIPHFHGRKTLAIQDVFSMDVLHNIA